MAFLVCFLETYTFKTGKVRGPLSRVKCAKLFSADDSFQIDAWVGDHLPFHVLKMTCFHPVSLWFLF